MPLNSAKVPSPWRKKRSIGIMRSIALLSAGGGGTLRAVNACASGSRSSSNSDQRARIAADMAAVGQDLALELGGEPARRAAQMADLARHGERRIGRARCRACRRGHAVARVAREPAQIAHLAGQVAQEAAIEADVGVVEDQRRLGEPGDDAARHRLGPPGERMPDALQGDPFVDQGARIGARDGRIRRRADGAASRTTSSVSAHSSDGGIISNGERPSHTTTLPAKAKRPP